MAQLALLTKLAETPHFKLTTEYSADTPKIVIQKVLQNHSPDSVNHERTVTLID